MSSIRTVLLAASIVASATSVLAAKPMSDRDRRRAEAQNLCYDDVQRLCGDAMPDEGRIIACMKVKRDQLSAGCSRVFEAGMGG